MKRSRRHIRIIRRVRGLVAVGMAAMLAGGLCATSPGGFFLAHAAPPEPAQPRQSRPQTAALNMFLRLLGETGVRVRLPSAYRPSPPPAMRDLPWSFDRAWRHPQGLVEVRMMVRPLARMEIDYDDPHSAAPHPDHVHPLVFQSLINHLAAAGSTTPSRVFPMKKAKGLFNADWAAMAAFAPDPAVNTRHREAMLLAVHKKKQGDVFVLFLFSQPKRAKEELERLLSIVRFADMVSEEDLAREEAEAKRQREAWLKEAGETLHCMPPDGARLITRKPE